jgi:hypothetical protein
MISLQLNKKCFSYKTVHARDSVVIYFFSLTHLLERRSSSKILEEIQNLSKIMESQKTHYNNILSGKKGKATGMKRSGPIFPFNLETHDAPFGHSE